MICKIERVFPVAVLALLGLSSPCRAQDLSLAAFGGALGLVAGGYLRDSLVFGLEPGYDAYPGCAFTSTCAIDPSYNSGYPYLRWERE